MKKYLEYIVMGCSFVALLAISLLLTLIINFDYKNFIFIYQISSIISLLLTFVVSLFMRYKIDIMRHSDNIIDNVFNGLIIGELMSIIMVFVLYMFI